MAADMVNMITSEESKEMDWAKSIEICELVTSNQRATKDVIEAIKRRLGNKNANTKLFAVLLLEMLMNNCGEHIHTQVIDNGLLEELAKIVKKKTDLLVRERILLLLDATQTALGGASGKFPQYYAAYYDLAPAQVQFPQRPHVPSPEIALVKEHTEITHAEETPLQNGGVDKQPSPQIVPDSGIIDKATSVLNVLREVISALDPKCPEGANDEFVLDLVEQCSFQKQRVMHLILTSRDERVVTRAIELNEQLQKILVQHDALLSVRSNTTAACVSNEEDKEEEEDEEHLYRRIRKGKACAEDQSSSHGASFRSIPKDKLQRPLCIKSPESNTKPTPVSLPPPPAKHDEREKFFKENRTNEPSHSRNGSSSRGGNDEF